MPRKLFPALFAAATFASVALGTHAAEKKIDCTSLPQAAQQSVAKESAGATVKGCSTEVENGVVSYELQTKRNGLSRDITMDASGRVLEVEQQVPEIELPGPVAAALAKAVAGTRVGKVESVSKGGTIRSYETTIRKNGRSRELAFAPDGSSVKPD